MCEESYDLSCCQKVCGSINGAITELAGRNRTALQTNFLIAPEFLEDVQDLLVPAPATLKPRGQCLRRQAPVGFASGPCTKAEESPHNCGFLLLHGNMQGIASATPGVLRLVDMHEPIDFKETFGKKLPLKVTRDGLRGAAGEQARGAARGVRNGAASACTCRARVGASAGPC